MPNIVIKKNTIMSSNKNELNKIRMNERLRQCLGLDIGDYVRVGGRPLKVYHSDSSENVGFVSNDLSLDEANESGIEISEITNRYLIGSDPEFLLINKRGRAVNANRVLPFGSRVGSDAGLGELRPTEAASEEEHLRNIRCLIHQIPDKTTLAPIARSYYQGHSAGFHIHFGLPKAFLVCANEDMNLFIQGITRSLDWFIGIPAAAYDPQAEVRASKTSYGRPGDYRLSYLTYEYRTVGAFYLRHPDYTRSLLVCCKLVIEDIMNRAFLLTRGWSQLKKLADVFNAYHLPKEDVIKKLWSFTISKNDLHLPLKTRLIEGFSSLYAFKVNEHWIKYFLSKKPKVSSNLLNNW